MNLPYLGTLRTSTLHLCSTDTPYRTLKPRRVSPRQLKKKGNRSIRSLPHAARKIRATAYIHIQPTLVHPKSMTTIYISISEILLSFSEKQQSPVIRVSEQGLSTAPLANAVLDLACQHWAQELWIIKIFKSSLSFHG